MGSLKPMSSISRFSLILSGPARAARGTDCSAGNSLQLSFWSRISNRTLSGRRDGVAGEAEAKAASRMAPRHQVEQELTQFTRKPLSRRRPFVLGFIQVRMFRFACKMECTQYHDEGFAATSSFLAPACPFNKTKESNGPVTSAHIEN
jgi:hypothetical protein